MRRILLLFIYLSVSASLVAQLNLPAEIIWGEELVEPSNSYLSKIITQDKDGFYVLRRQAGQASFSNAEKIYVERYDNKQQLQRSEKINLKYKKKIRQFEDIIPLDGQLFMLSSFHNQAKKINYLFAERITTSLKASGKLIKIGEIPSKNFFKNGFFDYHISKDSSKFLVYNQLPYIKGKPEQFNFQVYDKRFNQLWQKNITLPYNDETFGIEEYQVDNQGNVYVLGILYGDKGRLRRSGKPTYQYTILAYTNNGEEVEEYPIQLGNSFVTDLTFRVGNDGHLICSGFYSDKGTTSIKGTYFFRLNSQTKERYNENLKAFDIAFMTEDMNDRRKAKALKAEREGDTTREAELYRYALNELIIRSDGGALLIAEQFYIQERNNNYNDPYNNFGINNRRQQIDYIYTYQDIIVVNINPAGEIDWATKIPKRQVTTNDGGYYSSYAHAIVRDKIYFIYNDNRRNFEKDKNKRQYNFDGRYSIIALTEVRKDGSIQTYPLFPNKDANTLTRPKVCKQTGRKEMTIYGERGRKFRFAKLNFK